MNALKSIVRQGRRGGPHGLMRARGSLPSLPSVRQRGFTLIEMTVVAVIATVLTTMAARVLVDRAMTQTAEATGVYFNTVAGSLDAYMASNFVALNDGTAIAGFADPLHPTLAELRAAGHLRNSFPDFTPFNSPVRIELTRTNCPGATCRVDGLVWATQPLLDGAGEARTGVAQEVRAATRGGMASDFNTPAQLSGPTGTFPNPLGTQAGAVAVSTMLDSTLYNQFVRRNDTRITNLNEQLNVTAGALGGGVALTVNGDQINTGNTTVNGNTTVTGTGLFNGLLTAAGGAQVNGNLSTTGGDVNVQNGAGTNCVTLGQGGVVTISCAGTLNARNGMFSDGAGNSVSVTPNGVVATGRVAGAQGLSTGSATLFDAANPDRITVTGGQMFIFGATGQLVAFDEGDVIAARNLAGQRLSLQSTVTPGAACANTSGALAAGVEYASTTTGGMAVCRGGTWVALQDIAAIGSACTQPGAFSVNSADGQGLICRGGRWTNVNSLLSSFVLMATTDVTHDFVLAKPDCPINGGAAAGVPLLLLQAGNEGSPDATFNRYATDMGASWQIKLTDAGGNALGGARAIALGYCWYP